TALGTTKLGLSRTSGAQPKYVLGSLSIAAALSNSRCTTYFPPPTRSLSALKLATPQPLSLISNPSLATQPSSPGLTRAAVWPALSGLTIRLAASTAMSCGVGLLGSGGMLIGSHPVRLVHGWTT